MKCNPWRWLWGLIPILMLGWIAILGERGRIEADLSTRSKVVLERSGLGWASAKFDGRDAVLSGKALEEGEPAKAVAAMLDTMGVRVVEDRSALVEKVDRYTWSAIRQDNRIRLEGLVPSDKVRRDVFAMVKSNFPNLDVDDRLKTARGVPPLDAWLGGVGFGLKQLGHLKQGRVDLEQMSLAVSGEALDARNYQTVMGALTGNLPKSVVLKSESVRAPLASPYVWSARRKGDEVVLVGHVPNDTVRGELVRTARRVSSSAKVVDRMEPASGAPDGFAGVATALLGQLGALEDGDAQIRDKAATLSGTTDTAASADKIKGTFGSGVLASFRTNGEIRHREPLIKTIQPYVTSARVDQGVVVLTGYVPDDKARAAVVAMAKQRFARREVRDEMQLGAGQPQGWDMCVEAGLDAVQRLDGGLSVLTGRKLVVTGTTEAEPLAQSLPGDVRSRVGSSCDADVRIALDQSAVRARDEEKRRAEDQARQATADADRRRNEDASARQAAADADRRRAEDAAARQTAADADRRRAEDAAARQAAADADRRRAEDAAARQAAADADRRRAEDAAARQAAADADRRRAEDAARVATTAVATRETQKVVDVCQQTLSQIVREGIINFKRASFDLDPNSFPTLNKLASAANQCPTLLVEIGGHTDAEGTPERNQLLSDRRANSVREYLARAGVDQSRLAAVGYGHERNIAPNDTAENRAKNRRIEFVVKTQ